MIRFVFVFMLTFVAAPVFAQASDRMRPLFEALDMPELFEIMQEEGANYGVQLEAELFPRNGGEAWHDVVAAIYAPKRLEDAILKGLDSQLTDEQAFDALEFLQSDLGQRVVGLEIAARRAFLDEAVEEAAGADWVELEEKNAKRWQLLTEFAAASDLIESNIAGAMTANFAFYQGLMDGQAFEFTMTEREILNDVWEQEPQIRSDMINWVYSFTSLAYQPLTDEELAAYLEFTKTPEGKALNSALFVVFNELFVEISHELGLGAAHYIAGDDI